MGRPKKVVEFSSSEADTPKKAKASKKGARKTKTTRTTRKKRKAKDDAPFEASSSSDDENDEPTAVSPATLKLIKKSKTSAETSNAQIELIQDFISTYSVPNENLSKTELSYKEKYEALRALRVTEPEKLLKETQELAKNEKKEFEKWRETFEAEYNSEKAEWKAKIVNEKRRDTEAEHALEEKVGMLQVQKDHVSKENEKLKEMIKDLKATTASPAM